MLNYVSTSTKNRHKFDRRAKACVFLGYPLGYKGYKLLDIETHSVSVSRHVIFHEDIFPFALSSLNDNVKYFFPHASSPAVPDAVFSKPASSDAHLHNDVSSSDVLPSVSHSIRNKKQSSHLQDYFCSNVSSSSSTSYPMENYISYYALSESFLSFINTTTKSKDPQKYSEAMLDQLWRDTMKEEINSQERTKTWSVCTLPPDKKPIGCKWLYKTNYHADGTEERKKGRLVGKGYTKEEGVDYQETFSLVAKLSTVRVLIDVVAKMNWSLTQLDISNAFLNGDLEEEIYMKLLHDYKELTGVLVPPNVVCRLHKSLYGLKQASRQWYLKLSSTIMKMGFMKSRDDHTLFVKNVDGRYLAVLVYVDDILVVSNNDEAVKEYIGELESHFKLRNLGDAKYFHGLEIARSARGISVCQRKYILELLDDTCFLGCKPSSIPLDPTVRLSTETIIPKDGSKIIHEMGALLSEPKVYRRLMGRLMYFAITRADIAYTLTKLCQYSAAPRDAHLKAAHKLLRYLKGTVGQGLFYDVSGSFDLRSFANADWGSYPDSRKSITGYAMFLGKSLVTWRSKKQRTIS